jgi:VWFA-related protein
MVIMKAASCLLAAVFAYPLGAQNPAPAAQAPVFRTTSNEVLLDVVVRDKKGKMIRDLKPEDFTISDDGAAQKILSFKLREGAEVVPAEVPGAPAAATKQAELKLNPAREIRLVTLAFDRLGPEGKKLARQAALDVLKTDGGQPNLYWAVFMMDQRLSILQQYTSQNDKISAAVEKATAASYSLYTDESERIAKELEITSTQATAGSAVAPTSGPASSGQLASEAMAAMAQMTLNMLQFADSADRTQQGQVQLFGLAGMIREQKRLPGRKTLMYFTSGLNIPPERDDYFKALVADANRANVTVYCIDANGLGTNKLNASGSEMLRQAARGSALNQQLAAPVTQDQAKAFDRAAESTMANPQVKLEELSRDTGGFLIANTNDIKSPLRKVSEEINTYYEITYAPSIDKYDGHFRKISVSASRPDVKLQTRSGYYALPSIQGQDLLPYEVPMLSALSATPIPRAISYRSGVKSFLTKNGSPKEAVVFDIPMENVTLTKDEAEKSIHLHTSLLALVKDSTGGIVHKISRDVPFKGSIDNYEATRAGHFIYTQYMTLAPGRYTLESAVLDRENMKVGAKKQAIVVAQPNKDLSMSSLTLVRKLAQPDKIGDAEDPFEFKGGKVTPELNETVKGGKGAGIGLYFVVYAPQGSDLKLSAEFVQDGKLLAKSDLPVGKPDETGRVNYVASLPIESLKAGQYEVYVKAFQNGKGVQERLMLNIEE